VRKNGVWGSEEVFFGVRAATPSPSLPSLLAEAAAVGFPLLVKAVAGGGGKGMKIAGSAAELPAALAAARAEAAAAFGDDRLILERLVLRPRHVEVQVFADAVGGCVHLAERDCSVQVRRRGERAGAGASSPCHRPPPTPPPPFQRRHQKVIEEAPAPGLSAATRAELGAAAVAAARAVGYVGAGTVEFIFDPATATPYFCEMNTRLQVEHPVTEAVTGLDLVELQLIVAAGRPLPLAQGDVTVVGHAVEGRLYAERPEAGFLPAAGAVSAWRPPRGAAAFGWPSGAAARVDAGVGAGSEVGVHYDPMIGLGGGGGGGGGGGRARAGARGVRRRPLSPSQILGRGPDRAAAFAALAAALDDLRVGGLPTNAGLLRRLARDETLASTAVDTSFLADPAHAALLAPEPPPAVAVALAAVAVHLREAGGGGGGGGAWATGAATPRPATALPWTRRLALDDDASGACMQVDVSGGGPGPALRVACAGGGGGPRAAARAFSLALDRPALHPPADASGLWRVSAVDAATGAVVTADVALGAGGGGGAVVDVWCAAGAAPAAHACLRLPIPRAWPRAGGVAAAAGSIAAAPMPGRVARVLVAEGDAVAAGDTLVVLTAMKMEHPVPAPRAGVVETVHAVAGGAVAGGDALVTLGAAETEGGERGARGGE